MSVDDQKRGYKLLPCPWGDDHAVYVTGPSMFLHTYAVRCGTCRFSHGEYRDEKEAVKAWNDRVLTK